MSPDQPASAPLPETNAVPARLVVADDQEDLLAMMKDLLQMHGFEVRTAANGEDALSVIRSDPPDIVILDLWMPIKDGFTVCKELKEDPAFFHLPVILLSAASETENKIQGMELGADDFVTKPVDIAELLARIKMILRRTRQGLDANPLTHFPGNVSIQTRIANGLASKKPLAVLYIDLNNFKAYNDTYGYEAGDHVIRSTAHLLLKAVKSHGAPKDFVGHIGGDDFIVVTSPDAMEALSRAIVSAFDELAPSFYKPEDRARRKIVAHDRQGNPMEYPFLSVAIGVCHNTLRPLTTYAQVSAIGAELKGFAKRQEGSSYMIDRRRE